MPADRARRRRCAVPGAAALFVWSQLPGTGWRRRARGRAGDAAADGARARRARAGPTTRCPTGPRRPRPAGRRRARRAGHRRLTSRPRRTRGRRPSPAQVKSVLTSRATSCRESSCPRGVQGATGRSRTSVAAQRSALRAAPPDPDAAAGCSGAPRPDRLAAGGPRRARPLVARPRAAQRRAAARAGRSDCIAVRRRGRPAPPADRGPRAAVLELPVAPPGSPTGADLVDRLALTGSHPSALRSCGPPVGRRRPRARRAAAAGADAGALLAPPSPTWAVLADRAARRPRAGPDRGSAGPSTRPSAAGRSASSAPPSSTPWWRCAAISGSCRPRPRATCRRRCEALSGRLVEAGGPAPAGCRRPAAPGRPARRRHRLPRSCRRSPSTPSRRRTRGPAPRPRHPRRGRPRRRRGRRPGRPRPLAGAPARPRRRPGRDGLAPARPAPLQKLAAPATCCPPGCTSCGRRPTLTPAARTPATLTPASPTPPTLCPTPPRRRRRDDVLICDDHRIVREGLRQFVAGVPGVDRVETAASGEEVLARFPHEQPRPGAHGRPDARSRRPGGHPPAGRRAPRAPR